MKKLWLAALLWFPLSLSASPLPDFPFVVVSQKISQEVTPDKAKVSLKISTKSESLEAAMTQLQDSTNLLVNVIKLHHIPTSALESYQLSKYANSDEDKQGNLIKSFEVSQSFELTLVTLADYPALMNDIVHIAAVESIYPTFSSSTEEISKEKLLEKLSHKTREAADKLAQAQGRTVDKVYGITTDSNFERSFAKFSLNPYDDKARYGHMVPDDIYVSIPKYITLSAHMTAIYKLKGE